MNKEQYLDETETQLSDIMVYKKRNEDPTKKRIKREINIFLQDTFEDGTITREEKEALTNDTPKTPILYLVPKIHKDS